MFQHKLEFPDAWLPHGLENLKKWENIFQPGKSREVREFEQTG